MKRPAFQFYTKDWKANLKLRRCSDAAKGAWVEIMCVLHDSEEYGVARFPLKELVNAAGVQAKSARELVDKGVLKGGDRDVAGYVYRPRHAGKVGEAVTLLEPSEGPLWYCSRFVRDEWIRARRGESTRFTPDDQPPKGAPNTTPKPSPKPPLGERQGDGSAVASASAVNSLEEHRVLVEGAALQPVHNPARSPGRSNPRAHGAWRRDPNAAQRKLTELGLMAWSKGKSHQECIERIELELKQRDSRNAA
jgi:hypothetical protein